MRTARGESRLEKDFGESMPVLIRQNVAVIGLALLTLSAVRAI